MLLVLLLLLLLLTSPFFSSPFLIIFYYDSMSRMSLNHHVEKNALGFIIVIRGFTSIKNLKYINIFTFHPRP